MGNDVNGRRPASSILSRAGLVSLGLVLALSTAACTTTEGTNAMGDFNTFEREVMTSTLQGIGIIDRQQKQETDQRRGPLVLPKQGGALPTPQTDSKVAMLPADSANPQIDTTGLSQDDLKRLRNARVVDLTTLNGRPLTDAEVKQLTARMKAARVQAGPRPLYLPPEDYYTTVQGQDLVCLSKGGDLVTLTDPKCPPEIRKALSKK